MPSHAPRLSALGLALCAAAAFTPSPAQAGDGITVYQHCDYGGYGVELAEGRYDLAALEARGVTNDDLSSIRVPQGYQVVLWQHNFEGSSLTLSGDDSCFIDDGLNDEISSIEIKRTDTPKSSAPTVYQHCDYGGYGITVRPGRYELSQLEAMGVINDDLSSIRVPDGFQVTLWQHNFEGESLTLTGDDSCFVDDGLNDTFSSIEVKRTDGPRRPNIRSPRAGGGPGAR